MVIMYLNLYIGEWPLWIMSLLFYPQEKKTCISFLNWYSKRHTCRNNQARRFSPSLLHDVFISLINNVLPPPTMMLQCCPLNLGLSWGTYCSWPHFYDSYHCDLLCHNNYKRQCNNSFLSDDPTSCILRTSTYFCSAWMSQTPAELV